MDASGDLNTLKPLLISRRANDVIERLVDGELVLYDAANQRVHSLNPTAAFVWLLCDGEHTEGDIVTTLAERYPENAEDIGTDVADILDLFSDAGLVETRPLVDE